MLDTGAGRTILNPRDAMRAGIKPGRFGTSPTPARSETVIGVGSRLVVPVVAAVYRLIGHDGSIVEIDADIRVLPLEAVSGALPSLLGWDLLQFFALHADASSGRLDLEPHRASQDPERAR
jgi:hypothetical protein